MITFPLLHFLTLWYALSSSPVAPSLPQDELEGPPPPSREFRAFWITTLDNKDFPSRPKLPVEELKAEIREILDYHHQRGMNAAIFQVRPCADAFYESPIEPWSEFLWGMQGKATQPAFDPLEYMIEECHKRQMELHAWFNPYRAQYSLKLSDIHPRHITRRRPDWFIEYGKHLYFNPGLPQARDYVVRVILDVARRYDIDGVHFDDYFYPYKIWGKEFDDTQAFQRYGRAFHTKGAWRRNNINTLIRMIHDSLDVINPRVKFGVSPIGVWRNRKQDWRGSATNVGQTSYDYLSADVLKWLEQGWIDYVAPQLYWSVGHKVADYTVLADWWAEHHSNRHIYIGQAYYKYHNDSDRRWYNPQEMINQIKINRARKTITGNIFFRARYFMKNTRSISDKIHQKLYKYPSLIPPMTWKDSIPPAKPQNLRLINTPRHLLLKWESAEPAQDGELPAYYVIYRYPAQTDPSDDPRYIVSIQKDVEYIEEREKAEAEGYYYRIVALDRLHNASEPAELSPFQD